MYNDYCVNKYERLSKKIEQLKSIARCLWHKGEIKKAKKIVLIIKKFAEYRLKYIYY